MSPSFPRTLALLLLGAAPLAAIAACAADNGAPVGSVVYDASPLEPPENPAEPAGPDAAEPVDASPGLDGSTRDAAAEAAPEAQPVVIAEIYVDLVVRGDATEYVELRGTPGAPVDDLKLRVLSADGSQRHLVNVAPSGATFPASGLWVVGGGQTFRLNVTDHVDTVYPASDWGLDTRGAVQLLRGTTLLDVVGYGPDPDAGAVPAPPSPPSATSEGTPVRNATQPSAASAPARSIGRRTGSADTNANTADFCAMVASPGAAQKPCE